MPPSEVVKATVAAPIVVSKPWESVGIVLQVPEVQVPIKKYYGRRKEDHSDSELSYSDADAAGAEEKNAKEAEEITSKTRDLQRSDSNS